MVMNMERYEEGLFCVYSDTEEARDTPKDKNISEECDSEENFKFFYILRNCFYDYQQTYVLMKVMSR